MYLIVQEEFQIVFAEELDDNDEALAISGEQDIIDIRNPNIPKILNSMGNWVNVPTRINKDVF